MAGTPPPPPTVQERSTEQLLDELCVELRHVAIGDSGSLSGEKAVAHLTQVSEIHRELV